MSELSKTQKNKNSIVRSKKHKAVKKTIEWVSAMNPKLAANIGLKVFSTPFHRRQREDLWPDGVRVRRKSIAGKKVVLYKYGYSSRKILMIHGWEGAATDFSHFFEPLVEGGYEVVAIDLPGHGFSPFSQLNAIEAGDIVRELEMTVGPFTAVVGHSFGAFSTGYALSRYEELEGMPFISIGSPNKLKSIMNNFSNVIGFNEKQRQYLLDKIESDNNIKVNEFAMSRFLGRHNGPSLIVHDVNDQVVPNKVVNELKDEVPGLSFIYTEGLGHNRILRDKQTIFTIIEFINNWKDSRGQFTSAHRFGLI